jgi:chromosome segregation ATPase
MNRRYTALLLSAMLGAPLAHSKQGAKMTPALKARLDAIGAAEKSALKPLQEKERELRKKRDALTAARVQAHQSSKSKNEAKASPAEFKAETAALSKEIAADPAISGLEADIKAVRKEMKERRADFEAQREAAAKTAQR